MTTIPLAFTGRPKRDIVEAAYEYCGTAGYEFERTAEEYSAALRKLNMMMAEWMADGLALGYNVPGYGVGQLENLSGLPDSDIEAVSLALALRLAPQLGVTFSPEARQAMGASIRAMRVGYAKIPARLRTNVLRGTGNRRLRPYLSDV